MTKIFSKPDTILSIDGFIYLVDKEAEYKRLDWITSYGTVWQYKPSAQALTEEDFFKIIATNNPSLEGVAKIGELERVWDKDRQISFSRTMFSFKERPNITTGDALIIYNAGYKAASSKKKYTEDDILRYMDLRMTIWKELIRENVKSGNYKDQENPFKWTEDEAHKRAILALKPSPISIEIEWEEEIAQNPNIEYDYTGAKLKDGYVIIKEVKYE